MEHFAFKLHAQSIIDLQQQLDDMQKRLEELERRVLPGVRDATRADETADKPR